MHIRQTNPGDGGASESTPTIELGNSFINTLQPHLVYDLSTPHISTEEGHDFIVLELVMETNAIRYGLCALEKRVRTDFSVQP